MSKDVRLTAATGALPLSPADQIELLFLLSRYRDEAVSAQASTSLQAMDEASLISVLKEVTPAVTAGVLARAPLEAVRLAGRVGLGRRRLAEQTAQVDEVLLRGRPFLQLGGAPLGQ